MKSELLAAAQALVDQINALPDDPAPVVDPIPAPTGLRVTNTSGDDSGLNIGIGWDFAGGQSYDLQYQALVDGQGNDTDWTGVQVSSPGDHDAMYTLVEPNPTGKKWFFRARVQGGEWSENLQVNASDYLG